MPITHIKAHTRQQPTNQANLQRELLKNNPAWKKYIQTMQTAQTEYHNLIKKEHQEWNHINFDTTINKNERYEQMQKHDQKWKPIIKEAQTKLHTIRQDAYNTYEQTRAHNT
jgi:hypothetical protein